MSTPTRAAEILLVEDSPTDVLLTRDALALSKLIVNLHVVENGARALAFMRREPPYGDAPLPDLVLLDLNLPGQSGHEILGEIKQDEKLRSIPVVILTASEDEKDVARSYGLHANCYVTKPVGLEGLRDVVSSIEGFWFSVVTLPRPLE